MDNTVALVEAYLRVNGYFTVSEYPILEADFRTLVADLDKFGEAFVEQLATFALRRAMTVDDAAALKTIAQSCKKDDYRLKTVIEQFVVSGLFQKR